MSTKVSTINRVVDIVFGLVGLLGSFILSRILYYAFEYLQYRNIFFVQILLFIPLLWLCYHAKLCIILVLEGLTGRIVLA